MKNNLSARQRVIIFMPAVLLVAGYLVYTYFPLNTTSQTQSADRYYDVTDIEVTDTAENLKSKMAIYDRKFDQESGKSQYQRAVKSDQDFFGQEINKPLEKEAVAAEPQEKKPEPKKTYEVRYVQAKPKAVEEPEPAAEPQKARRNAFYSATANTTLEETPESSETIYAVIHNDQEVKAGSSVELRTLQPCTINGAQIPRNTFLSGVASFSKERVLVKVTSFNYNNRIHAIDLHLFDQGDGQKGIYIPGGIIQEAGNDVLNTALEEVSSQVRIPVLGTIPIKAAKNKVNEPTVMLRSGHKVLLK